MLRTQYIDRKSSMNKKNIDFLPTIKWKTTDHSAKNLIVDSTNQAYKSAARSWITNVVTKQKPQLSF